MGNSHRSSTCTGKPQLALVSWMKYAQAHTPFPLVPVPRGEGQGEGSSPLPFFRPWTLTPLPYSTELLYSSISALISPLRSRSGAPTIKLFSPLSEKDLNRYLL